MTEIAMISYPTQWFSSGPSPRSDGESSFADQRSSESGFQLCCTAATPIPFLRL